MREKNHEQTSGPIVKPDRSSPDEKGRSPDEKGRVLRFRPRSPPQRRTWRWPLPDPEQSTPVDDLSKYERAETADDYRHRMLMNLLTLLVAVLLIGSGLWLTGKIVEVRNLQDCFLTGRRNCAPIQVPSRPAQ